MAIKLLHKLEPGVRLQVCAYARISNDKEILESSLEEQINAYTDLILENPSWEFKGIYIDKGISGTSLKQREQFLKMIQDAKSGFIDVILVKSISRFARNLIDLLTIVRELRKIGVEVYFEQQAMSSLDTTCDQMITLFAEFAEEEAKSVSLNVHWRNEKNRREGRYYVPANQMLGFTFDEDGKLAIDENEAKWVRKIFELYVSGMQVSKICDYLDDRKVKTATGKTWSSSSVRTIVKNEKYVGDCIMQKDYVPDYKTHLTKHNHGEKEMVYIQNGHVAIVSRDVWNKAQELLKSRRDQFNIKSYKDDTFTSEPLKIYASYLYCPYCGKNYQVRINKHSEYETKHDHERKFLVCASNARKKTCKNGNIYFSEIENVLIKELQILRDNISPLKEYLINNYKDDEYDLKKGKSEDYENKINSLRTKLSSLNDKNDDFSTALKDTLKSQISELTKLKLKIDTDLLRSDQALDKAYEYVRKIKNLPYKIETLEGINFRDFFSKIIVKDQFNLMLVIGNEDASKIAIETPTVFNGQVQYLNRKTTMTISFGVVANR